MKKPFHNPFAALEALRQAPAPKGPAARSRPVEKETPRPRPDTPVPSDEALFLEAVGQVQPVRSTASRVPPPPRAPPARVAPALSDDDEALVELAQLVSGPGDLDVVDSADFLQGGAHGLDPRVLRKLKAGDFPVQATLDLHGLTQREARAQVEGFVQRARTRGLRCVLLVTGKGLHSPDSLPVLKSSVQRWLASGKLSAQVLGFCSARPQDGGTGAVYVLLRR